MNDEDETDIATSALGAPTEDLGEAVEQSDADLDELAPNGGGASGTHGNGSGG
jgi:hypothetical protein